MTGTPPTRVLERLKTAAGASGRPREKVLAFEDEIREALEKGYTYRSIFDVLEDELGGMSYFAFAKHVQRHIEKKPTMPRARTTKAGEPPNAPTRPTQPAVKSPRKMKHLDQIKDNDAPTDPHEGYLKRDEIF